MPLFPPGLYRNWPTSSVRWAELLDHRRSSPDLATEPGVRKPAQLSCALAVLEPAMSTSGGLAGSNKKLHSSCECLAEKRLARDRLMARLAGCMARASVQVSRLARDVLHFY